MTDSVPHADPADRAPVPAREGARRARRPREHAVGRPDGQTAGAIRPLASPTAWFTAAGPVRQLLGGAASRQGVTERLRTTARDGVAVAAALAELAGELAPSLEAPWERALLATWAELHERCRVPLKRLRAAVDALADVGAVHYAQHGRALTFTLADGCWGQHPVLAAVDWRAVRQHLDARHFSARAGLAVLRAVALTVEAHWQPEGAVAGAELPTATTSLAHLSREALYAPTQVAEALDALEGAFLQQALINGVRRPIRLLPAVLRLPVSALPVPHGGPPDRAPAPAPVVPGHAPARRAPGASPRDAAPERRAGLPAVPVTPAPPPGRDPAPPEPAAPAAGQPDAPRGCELRYQGQLRATVDPGVAVRFRRTPDGRVVVDIEGGWTLE